jgi:hypothetical protein
MRNLLCGFAILPFMAATSPAQPPAHVGAAQQPLLLSEAEMDGVTAGWSLRELEFSNTSITAVAAYQTGTDPNGDAIEFGPGNNITCDTCYILLNSRALSVGSIMLSATPTG